MFRGNKKAPKKKETLLSCPFCGLAFEDVTLHLDTCSGVQGNQPKQPSSPPVVKEPTPAPQPVLQQPSQPTPPRVEQPEPQPQPSQNAFQLPPLKVEIPSPKPQQELLSTPPQEPAPLPPQNQNNNNNVEPTLEKVSSHKSIDAEQNGAPVKQKSPRKGSDAANQEQPSGWTKPFASAKERGTRNTKFSFRRESEEDVEEKLEERNDTKEEKNESSEVSDNSTGDIENNEEENEGEEETARVIYDYIKENDGEIEVYSGDIVVVLDSSNPEWYYIRKDTECGYVAANYLEPINFTPSSTPPPETETSTPEQIEDEKREEAQRNRRPTTSIPVQPAVLRAIPGIDRTGKSKSKFLSIKTFSIGKKSNSSSAEFSISRNDSEFTISRNDSPSVEQNPSDVPPSPTVEDKADQRTKIAREILSTEQHYVRVLKALEENYKQKISERIANESFGKGDQKVTQDNLKEIFVNINMILPFNLQLLGELDKCLASWDENSVIADVFFRLAPFLKMYNQYSNSYDNALSVLARCTKLEKFALLVEECDATTGLSARLDSLLIAPIQRIPRYTLLLSEMKKHTPEGHPDQANLDKAIPLLQEVADYINKNILLAENRAKLLSLSMAGAQSLLKPHRSLLHEGVLVEKKSKLHLWLFNDIIVHITEAKAKDKRNLNDPKNQWPLHLVWLEKKPKNTFTLVGPTARYTLTSQPPEEADKWLNNIIKVLDQHFEYLSVTQDLDLRKEKEANMKADSMARYGTYEFPTGEVFSGWWNDGKMHGFGKFTYFGSTYVGNFKDSLKDGAGVLTYNNGSVYEGEWVNDKPHGSGTLRFPNGDVYLGPWKEGKRAGKGEFKTISGDSYTGEWADDVPEGLGEMYYKNGDVYNGNWSAGLRSHYGIMINKDGTRYEGEWVAGVKHGKGRMEYAENFFYNGYWKEGMYYGQGKLVTPGGTYDGEWVADLKEGNGTFTYPNGCVYKGQWKKNLYHGTGTLNYSAGIVESYTGEWAGHRKNGSGVLKYFNSDSYDGHFKENMFHGSGTFTWADGSYLKSKWVKGRPAGESTFGKGKDKSSITHGVLKDGILSTEGKPNIYLPNLPPIWMEM